MTRYYKNAITVEWLSNQPWGDEAEDLDVINYEISDGDSIGYVTRTTTNAELTRDEAIATDISYGGDGTFLTGLADDEQDTQ